MIYLFMLWLNFVIVLFNLHFEYVKYLYGPKDKTYAQIFLIKISFNPYFYLVNGKKIFLNFSRQKTKQNIFFLINIVLFLFFI